MLIRLTAAVPAAHATGHTSPVGFIVGGAVAILIGVLHAVNPGLSWRLSRWQYRNRDALQPSNAGLIAIRIGGVIAIVFGIVLIIIGIAKK